MIKLQSPFIVTRKKPRLISARCFHCGKGIYVTQDKLRVTNFCEEC